MRLGRSNLIAKRWITHYALCMLFASKLAVVRSLMLLLVVCSQLGAARAQANSSSTRAHNQDNELISLIHDFEAKASKGTPRPYEDADPVIERFEKADKQSVQDALPEILRAGTSPYKSVRSISATTLFEISMRPEGRTLLLPQTATLAAFLIDPDTPIRRVTGLALANLRLDQTSPLVSDLEAFLSREDAVTTIGAGVAGLLMQAAPDDAASTTAIVHYMERSDQTLASRRDLLQSVRVARSHNREIGSEVAAYAETSDEGLNVDAIETLGAMGAAVVSDHRQWLLDVAADDHRGSAMRSAAKNVLASVP